MNVKKNVEQSKILSTSNSKNTKETKKEKIQRLWKISVEGNFKDWDEVKKELLV